MDQNKELRVKQAFWAFCQEHGVEGWCVFVAPGSGTVIPPGTAIREGYTPTGSIRYGTGIYLREDRPATGLVGLRGMLHVMRAHAARFERILGAAGAREEVIAATGSAEHD